MILQRLVRRLMCYNSCGVASALFQEVYSRKELLLTFDDGPHPKWTPKLLNFLTFHNIRGVFFVTGKNIINHPDLLKRIIHDGHVLGNHTYSHKDVNVANTKDYIADYCKCEELIGKYYKMNTKNYFRPPSGLLGIRELSYFIRNNVPILLWTTDSKDSANFNDDEIVDVISSLKRKKEILLFHDDSSLVLDVLERVVPIWNEKKISLPQLYRAKV